jgi:radical SAM superfamily enzyme YgiQ (UPF0313 family)
MDAVRYVGDWILSTKRHSTTVSPDRQTVYSFDLEGRPISWYERGRVYKRSLASDLFGREREGGEKQFWQVSVGEAALLFGQILARLSELDLGALESPAGDRLERILGWTPARLLAERERFDAAYRPVAILPPDQYLAVVLQATFGCSWNRCTFCSFYQDRPFSVRAASEFREHCDRVRELLGRGEALRQRIFLADGNALILANDRLRPLFEIAAECFPGRSVNGFVDVFSGERKAVEEWAELARLGLRRVYVGLETGHDELLRRLNKPGGAEEGAAFIGALKSAGLQVSVILMVGVGGRRFARAHSDNSLALVSRLPLGEGDIVYLSPFQEEAGSEYAHRAVAEGLRPLDDSEQRAQYAELRDGIRAALPGAIVTRYDLREFVY